MQGNDSAKIRLALSLDLFAPRSGRARTAVVCARDALAKRELRAMMGQAGVPRSLIDSVIEPEDSRCFEVDALRAMRQSRDAVPEEAAADYEERCAALRDLLIEASPCTDENMQAVADHMAWEAWGYGVESLAADRWESLWRDRPEVFASWIDGERSIRGLPDIAAMLDAIRAELTPLGEDVPDNDIEAAARHAVLSYGDEELVALWRQRLLQEWRENPEQFAWQVQEVLSYGPPVDAATGLRALRIENVWRQDEPTADPDDAVCVTAVATWSRARRLSGERWEFAVAVARALTPLLAALEKWEAPAIQ